MPVDTNFPCAYCDFKSKWKCSVRQHIKAVHEKRRDHKCSLCDYAAGTRQTLSYHTKEVHEKIKDLECPHCDMKFCQPSMLNRHVKVVHKGIRESKCTICGKQFGTNENLKSHIKANHEKDKSVPAITQENVQDQSDDVTETTCQLCGFSSSKISELATGHYYRHFPLQDANLN